METDRELLGSKLSLIQEDLEYLSSFKKKGKYIRTRLRLLRLEQMAILDLLARRLWGTTDNIDILDTAC